MELWHIFWVITRLVEEVSVGQTFQKERGHQDPDLQGQGHLDQGHRKEICVSINQLLGLEMPWYLNLVSIILSFAHPLTNLLKGKFVQEEILSYCSASKLLNALELQNYFNIVIMWQSQKCNCNW